MMGIAGLPQGSNMPAPGQAMPMGMGQPPMPGMKPPAGGTPAGVAALTPSLAQMNKQQLLMEFMNPGSRIPKYALISAIDEKAKQEKAMAAVQGSLAQQQAQQQPGTVAQEVLQSAMQPVMARHGGAMHSYRQGGIVGYQSGGATSYPAGDSEEVKEWWEKLPEGALLRKLMESRAKEGSRRSRERFPTIYAGQPPLPVEQKPQEEEGMGSEIMRLMSRPSGEARYGELPTEAPVMPPAPPAPQVKPPPTETQRPLPASAAPTAPAATTTDPILEARLKELTESKNVPADVQAGREGIASLFEADMKARKFRMEQDLKDAERRREEAIKSAPGLLDPEGVALIASMIDPSRKGTAFTGITRGMAQIMAGQRAARQGAEKEYQEFQRLQRAEENLLSQMRTQEAVRLQALKERDYVAARQAQDAIYSTRMEFDKIRQERQDKQRQLAADEMRAQAAKTSAEASKTQAERPPTGSVLTPAQRAEIVNKAQDDVEKQLLTDTAFIRLKDPIKKKEYRNREMLERLKQRFNAAGVDVPEDLRKQFEGAAAPTDGTASNDPLGIRK